MDVNKWRFDNFLKTNKIVHAGIHCKNLKFFSQLSNEQIGGLNYLYITTREVAPKIIQRRKVYTLPRLNNEEYNKILSESIFFLQLTSATANNTVLECIARGTPIIVNPIGGIIDYLGEDYPLYYRNYHEAVNLIKKISTNQDILINTQSFLNKIRNKFHKDKFIKSLENKINEWL